MSACLCVCVCVSVYAARVHMCVCMCVVCVCLTVAVIYGGHMWKLAEKKPGRNKKFSRGSMLICVRRAVCQGLVQVQCGQVRSGSFKME